MMVQKGSQNAEELINYGKFINQFRPDTITSIKDRNKNMKTKYVYNIYSNIPQRKNTA